MSSMLKYNLNQLCHKLGVSSLHIPVCVVGFSLCIANIRRTYCFLTRRYIQDQELWQSHFSCKIPDCSRCTIWQGIWQSHMDLLICIRFHDCHEATSFIHTIWQFKTH